MISLEKNNLSSEENSNDSADVLLDETLKLLEGYEEGLPAKEIKGLGDCACCLGEEESSNENEMKVCCNSKACSGC